MRIVSIQIENARKMNYDMLGQTKTRSMDYGIRGGLYHASSLAGPLWNANGSETESVFELERTFIPKKISKSRRISP